MRKATPSQDIPRVRCDFNACGWSGEPDDSCFYVLDEAALSRIDVFEGARVFVFMEENAEETAIVGCEATLERYRDGWRARLDEARWYAGPTFW